MIIDINMHWDPETLFTDKSWVNSYIDSVPRAFGIYPELKTIPGTDKVQLVVSEPKGHENINCTELSTDSKARLKAMDEAKVDKALLRICIWQGWFDLELCKRINNEMAKYIKEHPGRFLGLASVPPWGTKDSLYELERCIKELGFVGVLCASHYGIHYLDEEEFKPYFKKINELGVPVCVHHTPLPMEYHSLLKYTNLRRSYGRCHEQMTSLSRILYSGLLDEFPNLRLIFTEMGGAFFAYTNLLAYQKSKVQEELERSDTNMARKIRGYLDRNIYFDITRSPVWSKTQIDCAIEELGADHILFGSSYPVRREWLLTGVQYLQGLDIGEKEKSLILGENAVRLFNIKE